MGWFKRIKRAATAVATGGFSETIKPMREGLKEVMGVNAMEDANDLAQKQYDEQKAAAAAEEKAATEAAYASIEKDRRRRAAMRGRSSTILTGSLGDTGLSVSKKTLLGG